MVILSPSKHQIWGRCRQHVWVLRSVEKQSGIGVALVWLGEDAQVSTHQVEFRVSSRNRTIDEWVSDEGVVLAEASLDAAKRSANEMSAWITSVAEKPVENHNKAELD